MIGTQYQRKPRHPKEHVEPRKCLQCRKVFTPETSGYFLCKPCRDRATNGGGMDG